MVAHLAWREAVQGNGQQPLDGDYHKTALPKLLLVTAGAAAVAANTFYNGSQASSFRCSP
jgi:hypothetical protein